MGSLMPYNDPIKARRQKRVWARTHRHPNWREVAYEQGFICRDYFVTPDCEYDVNFEFHHNGLPYERVMLCRVCHWTRHNKEGDPFELERGILSQVIDDLDYEIEYAGGLAAWKDRYSIQPSPRPSQGLLL